MVSQALPLKMGKGEKKREILGSCLFLIQKYVEGNELKTALQPFVNLCEMPGFFTAVGRVEKKFHNEREACPIENSFDPDSSEK